MTCTKKSWLGIRLLRCVNWVFEAYQKQGARSERIMPLENCEMAVHVLGSLCMLCFTPSFGSLALELDLACDSENLYGALHLFWLLDPWDFTVVAERKCFL